MPACFAAVQCGPGRLIFVVSQLFLYIYIYIFLRTHCLHRSTQAQKKFYIPTW